MTPAIRQKRLMKKEWPGRLCIFTMAGGAYQFYAPLFVKLCKKAYPDADVKVLIPGPAEIPGTENIIAAGECLPYSGPRVCAALRFLASPAWLMETDYVLITDVDMLIVPETPGIIKQHMMSIELNGTEIYDNWLSEPGRVPGIHFVRKEWWGVTERARKNEMQVLYEVMDAGELQEGYDEFMLHRIITDSGLPPPALFAAPWANHGLHLGAVRNFRGQAGFQLPSQAGALTLLDPDLKEEVKIAYRAAPWLKGFVEWLRREFPKA